MLDKFKGLSKAAAQKAKSGASVAASKAKDAKNNRDTPPEQYVVALDIGTEFVKVLIGHVTPEQSIEIIGVGRAHQALTDMQAGAVADIQGVVENCDKALNQAEQQACVSVRTAVIGIAGELVKGTTTTVRVSRKMSAKPLDLIEMERIIKLVQGRAEAKAKQQVAIELGGKDIEVRLVNSALVGIEIDGYPVTNPIGFQGKDVVVQLYTAFAPLIHIGALERVATELDLDLLAVAAEPFAVARSVLGDSENVSLSAILMDVGGGTTDIAVLNDGGVQGTKMFGIGGRAYTRSVERDLGVDFDKAEQLKVSLDSDTIAKNQAKPVTVALTKTLDVWISGVELALGEFTQLDHLPSKLFLCGGGSSLDMLIEKLQESDWYSNLPFTRKPVIGYIRPDQVIGITDKTGSVNDHTFITAMGLLRVGLDTFQYAGDGSKTMREKLDRMLQT